MPGGQQAPNGREHSAQAGVNDQKSSTDDHLLVRFYKQACNQHEGLNYLDREDSPHILCTPCNSRTGPETGGCCGCSVDTAIRSVRVGELNESRASERADQAGPTPLIRAFQVACVLRARFEKKYCLIAAFFPLSATKQTAGRRHLGGRVRQADSLRGRGTRGQGRGQEERDAAQEERLRAQAQAPGNPYLRKFALTCALFPSASVGGRPWTAV